MADRVEVDTSGLDRVVNQLRRDADPIGRRACSDVAARVADTTRGRVPHRSGRLAGSVRAVPAPDGATVEMGAPYARYVEYGGRGHPHVAGGRYLGPATRDADRQIVEQAERDLERIAR